MAVKHLQNVQKQQLAIAMASDPTVLQKFKSGFSECSEEVINYIAQMDVDQGLKQRLKNHLSKCITNVEQMAQFNIPTITYPFLSNGNAFFGGSPNKTCDISSTVGDQNNNPRIQIPQGLQLIPSRLPTGEFAFLVPNSNNLPYFSTLASSSKPQTSTQDNVLPKARSSAFETVVPSSNSIRTLSPPLSPKVATQNDDAPQNTPRTPSPHGFRPVNPGQKRNVFIPNNNELIQKPTPIFQSNAQQEVKSMRYPIHNNTERKYLSPKKIVEPLCIITNQAERFKQAQTLEDSANYEENKRGIKRKFNDGLLSLAVNQELNYKSKYMKLCNKDEIPSTSGRISSADDTTNPDTSSKDNYESNGDMWRPW